MKRITTRLLALFVTSIFLTSVHSADGVLEINQACAVNGGCFAGDISGFPVTIDGSAGVSYRLTGSLDLSAYPTVPGISISVPFVSLDLNGFEIAGATECEYGPYGIDYFCEPSNTGAHGIELLGEIRSVSIRHGTIRNMPDEGIGGTDALLTHVQDLVFSENAGWGVMLGDQSLIQNCRAEVNGGGGFSVKDNSNISHSMAYFNDGIGFDADSRALVSFCNGVGTLYKAFSLGPHSKYKNNTATWQVVGEPATCGGGICSDKRRFYKTKTEFAGGSASSACGTGFHVASLGELFNLGELTYDYVLGFSNTGSTGVQPTGDAWAYIGINNCSDYASNSGTGRSMALSSDPESNIFPFADIWLLLGETSCPELKQVWCIED